MTDVAMVRKRVRSEYLENVVNHRGGKVREGKVVAETVI